MVAVHVAHEEVEDGEVDQVKQSTTLGTYKIQLGLRLSRSELIFVTNITNYIRGEKICHVEKFQLSMLNLNNLWSFIEV